MSMWHLYMLKCADGTFYTGVAKDLSRRIKEHNRGTSRASKYTRSRLPAELVYSERCDGRSAALKREIEVKRLSRQAKIRLAASAGPGMP